MQSETSCQHRWIVHIIQRRLLSCLIAITAAYLIVHDCRGFASEAAYDLRRGAYRFSYESIELPMKENMGLAGVQYIVDIGSSFYGGIGFYGAVSGDRGGFFTGGFAGGYRLPLTSSLYADTGLYVGGGGGRGAPQGGGLMVRPHIGLIYDIGMFRAGIEYSSVQFPNGDIHSNQFSGVLDFPFENLAATASGKDDPVSSLCAASVTEGREVLFTRSTIAPRYTYYRPADSARNADHATKTGPFQVLGIEYDHWLGDLPYVLIQASGAVGGNADGYAEVFAGLGLKLPLIERRGSFALYMDANGAVGAAGGGNLDTGNGMITKISLGAIIEADGKFGLSLRAGKAASHGTFEAATYETSLRYSWEAAFLGGPAKEPATTVHDVKISEWRIRNAVQQYYNATYKDGIQQNISLLGVKLDTIINGTQFYITGQALSAVLGNAGGYSAGFMGIGYETQPIFTERTRAFIELLGGAGGGGGIDTGGGAIVNGAAGLRYEITQNLGLELEIGHVSALSGELNSVTSGISLTYRSWSFIR